MVGRNEYSIELRKTKYSKSSWEQTAKDYEDKLRGLTVQSLVLPQLVEDGFCNAIDKGWSISLLLKIMESMYQRAKGDPHIYKQAMEAIRTGQVRAFPFYPIPDDRYEKALEVFTRLHNTKER